MNPGPPGAADGARFHTTPWTLIEQLRGPDADAIGEDALSALCARYWPPIYGFYRHCGESPSRAADLTQGFFVDVVIGRRLFERADPDVARLRTLFWTALRNYRVDQHRSESLRTFSIDQAAFDDQEKLIGETSDLKPDVAFDTAWATMLFHECLRRCERHFKNTDRTGHWRAYELAILGPAVYGSERRSHAELLEETGFDTEPEVSNALRTVRKRVLGILREVVNESVVTADQAGDEYDYLVSLLS